MVCAMTFVFLMSICGVLTGALLFHKLGGR